MGLAIPPLQCGEEVEVAGDAIASVTWRRARTSVERRSESMRAITGPSTTSGGQSSSVE